MGVFFKNVGRKIMILSYIIFIILAVGSIVVGIVLMVDGYEFGIAISLAGPLVAWVLCWFLYGIGQLLNDVHNIRSSQKSIETCVNDKSKNISQVYTKGGYNYNQPTGNQSYGADVLPKL